MGNHHLPEEDAFQRRLLRWLLECERIIGVRPAFIVLGSVVVATGVESGIVLVLHVGSQITRGLGA